MNCPKCGYPTNYHGDDPGDRWLIANTGDPNVKCQLTQVQATLAAQRHAAAVRLLEIRASIRFWSGEWFFQSAVRKSAHVYQMALRDTGIQRKRKRDQ